MNREDTNKFSNILLVTTYSYDNGGRVLNQTQTSTTNLVNLVILSKTLSQYDRYGHQTFSALDANHNGGIDLSGPDRVTGYTTAYITKESALWQEAIQSVYPDFNSDRAVIASKSRRKLSNLGNLISVSESEDIRGNVTTATRSIDRNTGVAVSSTTVPTSVQSQIQFQQYGQLVESVSTTAITNSYAYDSLNRRLAVTDGRGNTSHIVYNTLGQTAYTEDAATNRTSYVYDQFGRQIETIDALNQSTHTVYDLRGNVIRQYGATYPVWYGYDVEGRMVAMATTRDTTLDPATVDSLDNSSLDVTRWVYDPATGLLTQKLYDDGKGPSYTYTPDGKLSTRTWARGIVTSYAYDVLGALLSVNYSDTTPDVTYTYDRLGRQLSAVAADVSTNLYAYSTNTLELVSETQNGIVINRSRDAFGRESGIALESDYDVGYGYDTFGRFLAVTHEQSTNTFEYSYLPGSSHVSGMTASTGHVWTRAYESNRNLITAVTNSFNGNLISAFDYINDEIGRRTARFDALPGEVATTNTFGYNTRSEVTSALMGTNTYGYVFDPIGNRIVFKNNADVSSYAANALNQYTVISNAVPVLPVHDADGNMTATGDGWHYTWNAENCLVIASNATHLVTYAYDHLGRMLLKTVASSNVSPTKSINYLWDGYNIIFETVSTNSSLNKTFNIWGLDITGALQGAGGVGGLLAVISPLPQGEGQSEDSTVYLSCYDVNGNITEYVSSDSSIVAHYEYSPLGEILGQSGEQSDFFSHRFSTKPWCGVTGLSEYQLRQYRPSSGRWLNRDPMTEVGGLNLYTITCNNAANQYDVLGLSPWLKIAWECGKEALKAIGGKKLSEEWGAQQLCKQVQDATAGEESVSCEINETLKASISLPEWTLDNEGWGKAILKCLTKAILDKKLEKLLEGLNDEETAELIQQLAKTAEEGIEKFLDGAEIKVEYQIQYGCVTQESIAGFLVAQTTVTSKNGESIGVGIPTKFGANCFKAGGLKSDGFSQCCNCSNPPKTKDGFNTKEGFGTKDGFSGGAW